MKPSRYADQQQLVNAKTGKIERVFVDLEAVYPNEGDPGEEMSFEELRAKSRGWLNRDWAAESKQRIADQLQTQRAEERRRSAIPKTEKVVEHQEATHSQSSDQHESRVNSSPSSALETTVALDMVPELKGGRQRKTKIREVKGETQTSTLQNILLLDLC